MEHTPGQQRKAHERGAAVLAKLATSFGVTVSDEEKERWVTLLTVMREVDEATLSDDFYPGSCHKALLEGKPYGEAITSETAGKFKLLYEASGNEERAKLDNLAHDIAYHNASIQVNHLEHLDVINDAIDHREKMKAFQATLDEDARYRADLFKLSHVSSEGSTKTEGETTHENDKRDAYNLWLVDFFIAYEQFGAYLHSSRDVKNGRHSMESVGSQSFSQAAAAIRGLARCLYRGTPRTALTLFTTSTARAGRKLTGRLQV